MTADRPTTHPDLELIDHGNGLTSLTAGQTNLYFSFRTCVAVQTPDALAVVQNQWGNATALHLNRIDGGTTQRKRQRLPMQTFQQALDQLLKRLNSHTPPPADAEQQDV